MIDGAREVDGPGDLDEAGAAVVGVRVAPEEVLADRPVDPDALLGDDATDGAVGAVEVAQPAAVEADRQVGGRQLGGVDRRRRNVARAPSARTPRPAPPSSKNGGSYSTPGGPVRWPAPTAATSRRSDRLAHSRISCWPTSAVIDHIGVGATVR